MKAMTSDWYWASETKHREGCKGKRYRADSATRARRRGRPLFTRTDRAMAVAY